MSCILYCRCWIASPPIWTPSWVIWAPAQLYAEAKSWWDRMAERVKVTITQWFHPVPIWRLFLIRMARMWSTRPIFLYWRDSSGVIRFGICPTCNALQLPSSSKIKNKGYGQRLFLLFYWTLPVLATTWSSLAIQNTSALQIQSSNVVIN